MNACASQGGLILFTEVLPHPTIDSRHKQACNRHPAIFMFPSGSMRNILVIALAGIGDALLSTPLIHELRAQFPDSRLDALVRWAGARDLLEFNPHLSTVHQQELISAGAAENLRFLWQLRREKYNVIFNTYPQSRTAYRAVARVIGAPQRLSHLYDNASLFDRLLVNRTLSQDYGLHVIDNNLNLLQLIGRKPVLSEHDTEIYLKDGETSWAAKFAADREFSQKKILGVHVGSGKTKNLAFKRWPLASYIELIPALLAAEPNLEILLFGGPEEKQDHEQILQRALSPRVAVAPTKNLREVEALLKHCHLFLSVDSAIMHLAAAAKVPRQFVIESPAFNKTSEPYRQPYTLIRNPVVNGRNLEYYRYDGKGIKGTDEELLRCMRSITVDMVFDPIRRALAEC